MTGWGVDRTKSDTKAQCNVNNSTLCELKQHEISTCCTG